MRIYVRQEPLRRPISLDIGPCLSVGELRAHVGAEALYLASRAGAALHTTLSGSHEAESLGISCNAYAAASYGSDYAATVPLSMNAGTEPLDDASLVMDIVPPHGTLTVGARPLPGVRSTPSVLPPSESHRIAPNYANGGQWHLTKNPTPLLTSAPGPPAATRRSNALLAAGTQALGPGQQLRSGLPAAAATEIADSSTAYRLLSDPVCDPDHGTDASRVSGTCASLPIGGILEEEPLLAPPCVEGNSAPPPPGGQPQQLHGEAMLGEDWDDLSVVEEVDDQTISERGAWSLASEIVHNAIIAEDGIQSPENMLNCVSDAQPLLDGMQPRRAVSPGIVKQPSGPRWQSLSEEIHSTLPPGNDQGTPESLVFAWGDNSSGQCLVGDARRIVEAPEHVPLRCLCTSLCCGSECSILVTKRGTLWGGGSNAGGTLSEDAGPGALSRPTYVDLAELENFDLAAVAAGSEHILAVTESGVLLAWAASNSDGQAGVGSELARASPVLPRTLAWPPQLPGRPSVRVATVACGDWHSLALTDSGEVYAFGSNANGQLGLGERVQRSLGPAAVTGKARGVPFRVIAAGMRHSLALTVSGALFAWGDNSTGCLGLGSARREQNIVPLPSPVPGLPGPGRHVAAGGNHSAVIVWKGRLFLAGDNSYGQLGQPRSLVPSSHTFCELEPRLGLCVRSVALGHEHSLLLTYDGQLYAFGRNGEGQCGPPCAGEPLSEVPVNLQLPRMPGLDKPLVIWAIAAGRNHNVVLCSPGPQERFLSGSEEGSPRRPLRRATTENDREVCSRGRLPTRRATAEPLPTRRSHTVVGVCDAVEPTFLAQASSSRPETAAAGSRRPEVAAVLQEVHQGTSQSQAVLGQEPPKSGHQLVMLRPITQPGVAPRAFTALSVPWLASLLAETAGHGPKAGTGELRQLLVAVLARPSVLNASFCYPGLRTARLDAAGLCKTFAVLCTRIQGLGQQLLDAAAEGLQVLTSGPMEDLLQRDQLRALVVYLCLPVHRAVPPPAPHSRTSKSMLSSIAHAVMRMSSAGRAALRDLVADECGDVRVLRDFLVPHVRSLAEDAIRNVGQQPWLAGPLWEVVAQLQLQRSLWEAVLLLQVLASASEHAALLLRPSRSVAVSPTGTVDAQQPLAMATRSESSSVGSGSGPLWNASASNLLSLPNMGTSHRRSGSSLLDLSAFQLTSLTEGAIPPEVEFWLFQEHAQFHQITPTEVIDEPWWSDAAGMLPRRFCSFMAHANLVPIAFKQRVLQVENVLRQRLSQEQVVWPQAALVLGGVRADPAAFYFMLSVSRQNLLRDTFAQMYSASPVDLRRPLRVEFAGEEAIDEGGVMREFFRLLSIELFAPAAGLFFEADDSRRLWFSPVLGSGRQLEDYWMVGVIVALAVYNNHPGMDVPLPSALFKKLKDVPTTHEDLAQLFPSQARSLEAILSWTPSKPVDSEAAAEEADREFMDTFCLSYCFAVPSSTSTTSAEQIQEAPLCEGGLTRPVLFREREDFASCVHEYLLHKSVQPQFESFARGFRRVCNSPLFDVLSPEELEAIVAGDKDLDFSRLRQGVQYEGYSATEPYVQSLWTVLEGFSMLRRRRFLAFCTGSDVAPAGGLQDLHLLVQKHGEEPTMRLPVAHTCFNLLLLPKYGSLEKLRMMLVTAIEWTEGFGLQ